MLCQKLSLVITNHASVSRRVIQNFLSRNHLQPIGQDRCCYRRRTPSLAVLAASVHVEEGAWIWSSRTWFITICIILWGFQRKYNSGDSENSDIRKIIFMVQTTLSALANLCGIGSWENLILKSSFLMRHAKCVTYGPRIKIWNEQDWLLMDTNNMVWWFCFRIPLVELIDNY